jgi:nucleotide-binding universal stress UspA family protein
VIAETLLVGFDGTDRARAAARGAARLADALDARMIVVGSYGEKPLRGAIIGSTPHRLLHLSERPVLVVRA